MSSAEGTRTVPMLARLGGISHCSMLKEKINSPHYDRIRILYFNKTIAIEAKREEEKARAKIKRDEGAPPNGISHPLGLRFPRLSVFTLTYLDLDY